MNADLSPWVQMLIGDADSGNQDGGASGDAALRRLCSHRKASLRQDSW